MSENNEFFGWLRDEHLAGDCNCPACKYKRGEGISMKGRQTQFGDERTDVKIRSF